MIINRRNIYFSIAIETVYTQQTGADHVQVYITIKCEVLKVDKVRHGPKQHEQQHYATSNPGACFVM